MRPWSDAFESSVVWTRRQLPLPFSRLPAGKCYKASASAPRQYQPGTMCSPVAWGSSIIFSFIYLFFSSSNYVWLTKNEHEAILLAKINEIICSGLLWRAWKRTVLNNLPLNFLHSHSHNSYTSTRTSISDSLKTNLLHELPSPAASWKRPCEQIASLKYEVKKNNTILSSSSGSGVCTFKVQSFVWAAVFCKAYFLFF